MLWLTRAADQGEPTAAYNLGVAAERGLTSEPDLEQAAKWYLVGANGGSDKAEFNLGALYATGRGVPKDMVQALKWFFVVNATTTDPEVKKAEASAEAAAIREVSPDDVAEARASAAAWVSSNHVAP
jgi:hypothetical protein